MSRAEGQLAYRHRVKEERLAKKMCIRCGFRPHIDSKQLCENCSEKMRRTRKSLTEERKQLHICIKCGQEDERTVKGFTRCAKCADREKITRLKRAEGKQ